MLKKVLVFNAGLQPYHIGLKIQQNLISVVKDETIPGYLIFVEHNPVYTTGIRDKSYKEHIETRLKSFGADFFRTNRGGLITFHGPGQMVVYPILNLNHFTPKIKWFIQELEGSVISLCKDYNLTGYTTPHTGVWVNDKKVCAMGLHVSQMVTSHGIALNCNTDLAWFDHIVPCGIKGKKATSLSVECGKNVTIDDAHKRFRQHFCRHFGCVLEDCSKEFIHNICNIASKT